MGFFIRKSLKVGPFRFNLSKSGVGVSAGIKGARIGTGPRGNYIHLGRHGLYYRQTLSNPTAPKNPLSPTPQLVPDVLAPDMKDIESGSVDSMVDSSSSDLLNEIKTKRKKLRTWPFVFWGVITVFLFEVSNGAPDWLLLATLLVGIIGTIYSYNKDQLNKTVILFYDFESPIEEAYKNFHEVFETLSNCHGQWHISASGKVNDSKYHAGANQVVNRSNIRINFKEPEYIKTNIPVPVIPVGRQRLYLFPERILVFDRGEVGAVSYDELELSINPTRFVEEGSVPRDATVIDHTWRYVNKSGGPDKRFKDNRQLPITLYDEVWFSSSTGLNECIQFSRNGAGQELQQALQQLTSVLKQDARHGNSQS
jgi:hypothetical protein